MKVFVAELLGTAVLVLMGCGSAVLTGYGPAFPMGMLPVALTWPPAKIAVRVLGSWTAATGLLPLGWSLR